MTEEQINKLENLHNKIYEETQEYGRTQFVSRIVDLENNWNELKKWLLCMSEVSHLDLKCLQSVLSKMQEIESGKNE